MEKLLDYIERNTVLCDGAMGTQLYERGIFFNRCFDEINLSEPELIHVVHRDYLEAGAQLIETNTFGANRFKLLKHHLEDKVADINVAAVEIARDAASGLDAWVAGAIGPLGVRIEPWGKVALEEARAAFREQAETLIDGGVDIIILETFGDISEIGQAIKAVKEVSDIPLAAQMTITEDGISLYGAGPDIFTTRLSEWGADIIGLNCSVGPHDMLTTLEKMKEFTSLPLSIMPNAGKARSIDGRVFYLASPDYFAKYAQRFIRAGAGIIGGCCGTTAEHIRAMAPVVRMKQSPVRADVRPVVKVAPPPDLDIREVPIKEKSGLGAKLAAGKYIYSLEITPPRGWELTRVIKKAKKAKEEGFDAVNLPDGPRASARIGVLAAAVLLDRHTGIEPVIHYACRDRSLLGMQSDLLGAFSLGLKNLLVVTGDPPVLGDYPRSTPVFDVDSIGLTNLASSLNRGFDVGGRPIGSPTGFLIGVGVNPVAVNIDLELERFFWKVDAGAEFAVTQPVFDTGALFSFLERAEETLAGKGLGMIPVLAGIWPLQSLKNAEFLHNEVPGVTIPGHFMDRLRSADGSEAERAAGLAIAEEAVVEVLPRVRGLQISSPFGRIKPAIKLLAHAREMEKRLTGAKGSTA